MANNLLLLLLIFHLFAAFSIPSEARCLENHRHALLQLKGLLDSTGYLPSWTNATDSDCCVGWHGVTCDPLSAGEVTSLDLNHLYLEGMVDPDALFSLTNLTTLNLAFNRLNFSEVLSSPRAFEKLHRLKVLNLSMSGFRGPIPKGIATLTNLVSLDLSILECNTDSSPPYHLICSVRGYLNYSPHLTQLIRDTKSLEGLYLDGVDLSSYGIDLLVALSESRSRLAELSLRKCMLSRSVYQSIAKLASLAVLRLDENNLTSVNFGFLRNLSSLEILGLSNCTLTGSIPQEIFLLKNLTSLDMSCNRLLGGSLSERVRGLVSLESLMLSDCNLSGPIPSSFFSLPSLKIVDLSRNKFGGKVRLNRLVGLQNLSSMDLSRNRLTVMGSKSSDAAMKNSAFPKMIKLKLASCNITRFPLFLKDQAELEYLDLSLNKIPGNIPSWLWRIGGTNSLKYLDLSRNILTGFEEPLFDLANTSLKTIDLHSNQLKGSFPLPPPGNEFVDYSNNNLSSEVPENISRYLKDTKFFLISKNGLSGNILPNFCESRVLKFLDVSFNNFSGPIPPCLGQLRINILNLRGNRFGDKIPSNLFNTDCLLRKLNLNSNHFSGNIPVSLRNCQDLNTLDLGNNRLDGEFQSWLGNLNNLSVLILKSNRFYGPVDVLNGSFERLQIVDLSSNNFSGHLPLKLFLNMKAIVIAKQSPSQPGRPWICIWIDDVYGRPRYHTNWSVTVIFKGIERFLEKLSSIYTFIDVSNNNFVGSIPDEIGKLNALVFLNASYNLLSGEIPRSIGNLKELQQLDFANNQLLGQIPREFLSLTSLSTLNLSYNNLSGVIPKGKQFNTFKKKSFFGNSGLCGFPLENSCSNSTTSNRDTMPSHHENKSDWWVFLFAGLGFGWGFVLIVASLLLCRRWGEMFNNWLDYTLFPIIISLWRNCKRPLDRQSERAE